MRIKRIENSVINHKRAVIMSRENVIRTFHILSIVPRATDNCEEREL